MGFLSKIYTNNSKNVAIEQYLSAVSGTQVRIGMFRRIMAQQLRDNDRRIRQKIQMEDHLYEYAIVSDLRVVLEPLFAARRPAVFVCPHWGDYVSSFFAIARALPDGSKFVVLRGNRWNEAEDGFWDTLNMISNRKLYVHRVLDSKSLVAAIRMIKGGAILFTMFDLFDDFGQTRQVNLFDQKVRFTSGWARIAYICDSVVVHFAPLSLMRRQVQLTDVIDPRSALSEDRFIGRCVGLAARNLESLISENPAYWFMWEHWEKYVNHDQAAVSN